MNTKAPKQNKLTPRQQRFVVEYPIDLNATQAAIRAGYTPKTARAACELLANPSIKAAIEKRIDEILEDRKGLTLKTIKELETIAFSDIKDYVDYNEDGVKIKPSSEVDTRALSQVIIEQTQLGGKDAPLTTKTIKFKLHPKEKGLEGLARYLGIFRESVEHSGSLNVTFDSEDEGLL